MKHSSWFNSLTAYTFFFLSIGALVSFPILGSSLTVPFGGQITQTFHGCLFPQGSAVTIGPPTPMTLMYLPGVSRSFSYGPPTHPGQWLLGKATTYTPCLVLCGSPPSVCPYAPQPGGLLILMHGSST